MAPRIAYLSPFFQPAVGGAAVYVSLLAKELLRGGYCDQFKVITERHPAADSDAVQDGVRVIRLFPYRAGANAKSIWSYLKYGWQNIQILGLWRHLDDIDILFVHGSFLNNPSTLVWALHAIRRRCPGVKLVLDLRDPKFPASALRLARQFDGVISCSANITARLDGLATVWDIPIMVEPVADASERGAQIAAEFGLVPGQFVFNGSGLNLDKGVDKLVDVVRAVRQAGHPVALAVAGKQRYWNKNLQRATTEGWFHSLGALPNDKVQCLAAVSWVDVNLSGVDSFPRHSLEAHASGAPVLFPPGIPELSDYSGWVVEPGDDISAIAAKIIKISETNGTACPYPWRQHLPEAVMPRYVQMLEYFGEGAGYRASGGAMKNLFRRLIKLVGILGEPEYRSALCSHRVAAGVEHKAVLAQLDRCLTVVDIGANRGQFALAARRSFPEAQIISFEPQPEPAAVYRAVFADDSRLTLHQAAIGPESGDVVIHVSPSDDSSSLLPISAVQNALFPGTQEESTSTVHVGPLGEFIDPGEIRGPGLLKLDVQGFELQALVGCEELLAGFSWVYVECSFVELYTGQSFADDVIAWLRERDFVMRGVYHMQYDARGRAIQADFLFGRG